MRVRIERRGNRLIWLVRDISGTRRFVSAKMLLAYINRHPERVRCSMIQTDPTS